MERWCQKINVHYFCLETALFGKIFGHLCEEKICVPPPPTLRGLAAQKKLYAVPMNFFHPPPLAQNPFLEALGTLWYPQDSGSKSLSSPASDFPYPTGGGGGGFVGG